MNLFFLIGLHSLGNREKDLTDIVDLVLDFGLFAASQPGGERDHENLSHK